MDIVVFLYNITALIALEMSPEASNKIQIHHKEDDDHFVSVQHRNFALVVI